MSEDQFHICVILFFNEFVAILWIIKASILGMLS